jgi:hypothetical protein
MRKSRCSDDQSPAFAAPPKEGRLLATDFATDFRLSRRQVYGKSHEGRRGGQLGAPTESARSEGSHRILFQIGLPYPAPSALKKRRASEPQRNPKLSANALSRDFTDHYR